MSARRFTLPPLAYRPAFWWGCYALWFAVLFGLSSISKVPSGTPQFMLSDKFAHAAYFTAGSAALALAVALRPGSRFSSNPLLVISACLLAAALVGAFDEWHQSFTPGRSGNDLGDWVADLVGGLLGALLGRAALRRLGRGAPAPAAAGR